MSRDFSQITPEYWARLEERFGFHPEMSDFTIVTGVTFEGRQALLEQLHLLCRNDLFPPVILHPEYDNAYDPEAIAVLVPLSKDELTGDWAPASKIGYLPRRRCPVCTTVISGPKAMQTNVCNECSTNFAPGTPAYAKSCFNKWIGQKIAGKEAVLVGLEGVMAPEPDPVTHKRKGSLGCWIWIRTEREK